MKEVIEKGGRNKKQEERALYQDYLNEIEHFDSELQRIIESIDDEEF